MADIKINTDIALEFGREFDIYELLNSDEMSELRAGFEPVPQPTDEELNMAFSWYHNKSEYYDYYFKYVNSYLLWLV